MLRPSRVVPDFSVSHTKDNTSPLEDSISALGSTACTVLSSSSHGICTHQSHIHVFLSFSSQHGTSDRTEKSLMVLTNISRVLQSRPEVLLLHLQLWGLIINSVSQSLVTPPNCSSRVSEQNHCPSSFHDPDQSLLGWLGIGLWSVIHISPKRTHLT